MYASFNVNSSGVLQNLYYEYCTSDDAVDVVHCIATTNSDVRDRVPLRSARALHQPQFIYETVLLRKIFGAAEQERVCISRETIIFLEPFSITPERCTEIASTRIVYIIISAVVIKSPKFLIKISCITGNCCCHNNNQPKSNIYIRLQIQQKTCRMYLYVSVCYTVRTI